MIFYVNTNKWAIHPAKEQKKTDQKKKDSVNFSSGKNKTVVALKNIAWAILPMKKQ